jgi:hypothetical protein
MVSVAAATAGAAVVEAGTVCSANANDVAAQSSKAIKTNFFICFIPFLRNFFIRN